MRVISTKRQMRKRRATCSRCQRRSAELLCWQCQADAPVKVRRAFQLAVGLDAMRAAKKLVDDYARGGQPEEVA